MGEEMGPGYCSGGGSREGVCVCERERDVGRASGSRMVMNEKQLS